MSKFSAFSRRRFLQLSSFSTVGFGLALSMHPQNLKAKATAGTANLKEKFEQALRIGTQAYIWGYSLVVLKRTLNKLAARSGMRVNQFTRSEYLATPQSKANFFLNNDTLYANAWLHLKREPIILHVPDTQGRYYSIQLIDAYANTFAYVGRRVTGTKESNYALIGPAWQGNLPTGIKEIQSPTNTVWCIARTLVEGEDDLPVARTLQQQYTLTPLSAYVRASQTQTPPSPLSQQDASSDLQFYNDLCAALQDDPPPKDENPLLNLFAQVGIGANRIPSQEIKEQATRDGLRQAISEAERLIDQRASNLGTMVNGWRVDYKIGTYGKDYLLRAAVAKALLGANTPEESVYFRAYVDGTGKPLSGANRYVLRFMPDRLPPVDAFWSLTVY